jgi:YopX protein
MIHGDEPGLSFFAIGFGGQIYILKGDCGEQGWSSVDEAPPILMQYTGLTDKNAKEIWEGDVVLLRLTDKYNHRTQVTCQHSGAWDYGLGLPEDSEVIGNIYEHPELLNCQ